jgi:hypothetical protein
VLLDIEKLILTGRFHSNAGYGFVFQILRGVSGAWQAPALPLANRDAWQAGRAADPAFGARDCGLSSPARTDRRAEPRHAATAGKH